MKVAEGRTMAKESLNPSNRVITVILINSQHLMTLSPLQTILLLASNTIFIGASRVGKLRWFTRRTHMTLKTDRDWRCDWNRFDYWNRSCPRTSRTCGGFNQLLSRRHCHLCCHDCFGRDELLFATGRRLQWLYTLWTSDLANAKRCHTICRSCSWIFSWVDILAQICYRHVHFDIYNYLTHTDRISNLSCSADVLMGHRLTAASLVIQLILYLTMLIS